LGNENLVEFFWYRWYYLHMKKSHVWVCDYCGKEYSLKKLCDKHELHCPKNPVNNDCTFRIKKQTIYNVFNILSIILATYFFSYLVVKSYATSNQKPMINFLKPHEWFQEYTPTKIPKATPYVSPTTEPSPTKEYTEKTTSNEPVSKVECIGPDGKQFWTSLVECQKLNEKWGKPVNYLMECRMSDYCGGGTKRIDLISCENGSCCQLDSGWQFMDRNICASKQNELKSPSTYKINTPQGEEKICRAEGVEDISTYLKLMTQSLKDYNSTNDVSILQQGIEYEKKYYEAIARYCTP